jgi:hypothetical protein
MASDATMAEYRRRTAEQQVPNPSGGMVLKDDEQVALQRGCVWVDALLSALPSPVFP